MFSIRKLKDIYNTCKKSNSNFLIVYSKYIYYKLQGYNIVAHQKTLIEGLKNIQCTGLLKIGVDYVGTSHNKDVTYLNVRGKMEVKGNFSIGRGCRFNVDKDAVLKLGNSTYINPFTTIIVMHEVEIGEACAISWSCQFLDEDFHQISYEGKKEVSNNKITVGNRVWIGNNVSVLKGTFIPDDCVVASNSVVKNKFEEKNCLIAGNPAKIVKRNISWR